MAIEFHIDPESGEPHIAKHGVEEVEVEELLANPTEIRRGIEDTFVVLGQTESGRYLRAIIRQLESGDVFVITAYDLIGKPLRAYKRRQRKRK